MWVREYIFADSPFELVVVDRSSFLMAGCPLDAQVTSLTHAIANDVAALSAMADSSAQVAALTSAAVNDIAALSAMTQLAVEENRELKRRVAELSMQLETARREVSDAQNYGGMFFPTGARHGAEHRRARRAQTASWFPEEARAHFAQTALSLGVSHPETPTVIWIPEDVAALSAMADSGGIHAPSQNGSTPFSGRGRRLSD